MKFFCQNFDQKMICENTTIRFASNYSDSETSVRRTSYLNVVCATKPWWKISTWEDYRGLWSFVQNKNQAATRQQPTRGLKNQQTQARKWVDHQTKTPKPVSKRVQTFKICVQRCAKINPKYWYAETTHSRAVKQAQMVQQQKLLQQNRRNQRGQIYNQRRGLQVRESAEWGPKGCATEWVSNPGGHVARVDYWSENGGTLLNNRVRCSDRQTPVRDVGVHFCATRNLASLLRGTAGVALCLSASITRNGVCALGPLRGM